jgi:hypothetical protein
VHLGSVFQFILEQKAFEAEYVGQYKTKKAYSYFMSGFVHTLLTKHLTGDRILVKGKISPS